MADQPCAAANVSATRAQSSSNASSRSSSSNSRAVTSYSLSGDVGWELDLWGRVRRTVEANVATAQASSADLQAARLSIHATLAQNYFQLRGLDAQKQLLDDTVAALRKSLQLTQNRYDAGVAAKAEVVQAETQLKTTEAEAIDTGVQRAQLEHAIAALIGKPAGRFSLAAAVLEAAPPDIPAGLPSQLLERRPDIAAAERRVAAANAQIGVAKAAFFPNITLSATGGYESSSVSQWLSAPSRFWSLGPALAQLVFDGGLRRAQSEQALALYDANVAGYRDIVLTAFKEVEDNLVALRLLQQEAKVQEEAVQAARRSLALTTNQYKAGLINYLSVITVQTALLGSEKTTVDLRSRRLTAGVLLIKALGGGWKRADL